MIGIWFHLKTPCIWLFPSAPKGPQSGVKSRKTAEDGHRGMHGRENTGEGRGRSPLGDPKTIIRVEHLRKVYRVGDEKVVALRDICLEVLQGQIVCVVGTSGSGKSTLLNQLAGLEKPTRGSVYIGKTNISKLSENQLALFRQRSLGFVFQSYNLMPTMTAAENVALPLIFKGVSRGRRHKAALKMLAAVGLKKRAYHKPTQMSGGQPQRVGIARAFVTKPKVIFADEPTGNLDTKTTIEIMKMMVRFARKYKETLIIVTHDPEIAEYADRVITLIDGEITDDKVHTPIYSGIEGEDAVSEDGTPQAEENSPPDGNTPEDGKQTPGEDRQGDEGLPIPEQDVPEQEGQSAASEETQSEGERTE